jgi:hypothetical protein
MPSRRSRKEVRDMTKGKDDRALDWETLRLGIERCDADLLIDLYAEDARLSIANADAPHASPFELGGKASHRVEREAAVGDGRVRFREACEYPDGGRVLVETTLELRDGKIVRQVDVVASEAPTTRREGGGRGPPR